MTEHYEPRRAVRALLVSEPEPRVLLIKMRVPDTQKVIWIAPGGGMDPGETDLQALIREVHEETGLSIEAHDGQVWYRRMRFKLHGKGWDQTEKYFLVHTRQFTPNYEDNPALDELSTFIGYRWWSLAELEQATDEIFVPLAFAEHFAALLNQGVPETPYDVGR